MSDYSDLTVAAAGTIESAWGNKVRDTVVTTYANAAARDAAIGSPTEGMCVYLDDTNMVTVYDGSSWVSVSRAAMVSAGTFPSGGFTFPGAVGVGGAFNANTTVDFAGLSSGAGTDLVIDGAGAVLEKSSAKSTKKLRKKVDKAAIRAALAELPVYAFTYKDDPDNERVGWMAEDVAKVDERLVNFKDGKPWSIDTLAVVAILA